jgi:hypothetical protein
MLAGDESHIKPDIRLRNFVTGVLGKKAEVSAVKTHKLIMAAYHRLRPGTPVLTPCLLDGAIGRLEKDPDDLSHRFLLVWRPMFH